MQLGAVVSFIILLLYCADGELITTPPRMFCVGVSTTFTIITRLDRLMVAAKEVVGEQYHIHGVGLDGAQRYAPPLGQRPSRDV